MTEQKTRKIQVNKTIALISGVSFLIVIALVTVVVLVIRSKQAELYNEGQAVFNESDLKTIQSGITLTDAKNTNFLYQSPVWDFSINLDQTRDEFIETTSGLAIYPVDFKSNYSISINVSELTSGNTLDTEYEREKKYIDYLDSKINLEKDININGITAKRVDYSYSNSQGIKITQSEVVLVNGNLSYLITYRLYGTDQNDGTSSFENILNSFKIINSDDINQESTYISSLWGFELKYNSKIWKIDASSNNIIYFNTRASNSDQERIDLSINSTEVSRFDLVNSETTYLDKRVDQRIGDLASNTQSAPGFKLNKRENVEINSRIYTVIDYEINNSEATYLNKYYREYFSLHYNTLTVIKLSYQSESQSNLSDAESIINSFTITEPSSGQVKGASTLNSSGDEQAIMLARPAVKRIYAMNCTNVKFPSSPSLVIVSGRTYKLCTAGFGSGFFVNSDGYVATNGHVVVSDLVTTMYNSIYHCRINHS